MKQILSLILLLLTGSSSALLAQKQKPAAVSAIIGSNKEQKEGGTNEKQQLKQYTAAQVMKIKIPEGGANGASVVYNPKEKLYYAAQAGNASFPLVIFDQKGNVKSDEGQATLIDVRGLWYNPKTKKIGGNGYKEFGWFTYDLNKNGAPEKINIFKEGRYQPDDHSPGVLNTENNEVLFLDGFNIACYSTDGEDKKKNIKLYFGQQHADEQAITAEDFENNYNIRSIVYTEMKGAEIGMLNIKNKQVELYNIKTGFITQIIKIPAGFTIETFFNFSYSNGIFWLFDKATRNWYGYK